jgi:hypothetical protein
MDYYKKYQKYKFKYLNLLNQSGGGSDYTEEDFILLDKFLDKDGYLSDYMKEDFILLDKFLDKDGYLKDKKTTDLLEDPISKESIHFKNAVLIDKEVYDVNSLFDSINSGHMTIPHNRSNYSPIYLLNIRNKLNDNEKKNIIFNKILNKFSENMQTQLMLLDQLKPEQLKIFFTKYDIFKSERENIILELVNYLLNNNITDENNNITEKFKENLKKNYKLLLFVPENKMTYEICMIAVNTSSFALKYIPKDSIMTKEEYFQICKIAVTQNGLALKFVPDNNKTFDICEIAVTQNGLALEFVPDNNKTFDICEIAVTQNGLAFEFVPDNNKTFDICEKAVTQSSIALKHIEILFINNIINMTPEQYYKLCEKAIENESTTFNYVKADNMTPEQYNELYKKALENNKHIFNGIPENKRTYEIYMLAVTKYGKHLENVKLNGKITLEQYYELCKKAVENYGQAIFDVKTEVINELNEEGKIYYKPKYMTPEQYYKLCEKALTNDGLALEYVNKNIKNITDEQYYKLYEIAVTTCGEALAFIPIKYKPKNMTDEQYYELCKKAVIKNGLSISYIPYNIRQNMGKEKYSEICDLAIANNKKAKPYAKPYEEIVQYIQNRMNRPYE